MYIIVGLGNPGKKYENTRHNMGFLTIDQIAEKYDIKVDKLKFKALTGEGRIAGQKVLLVKPQTFMNLSGESVREVFNFYKEDIENLMVIYDDIDIPTGTIRLRKSGSSGTHNGMRSVIYQLSDDGFPRVRVGIGPVKVTEEGEVEAASGVHGDELINYVTGGVSKKEKELLEEAILKARDAVICYIEEDIDVAMNRFNTKPNKKKKKDSRKEEKKDESQNSETETASNVATDTI